MSRIVVRERVLLGGETMSAVHGGATNASQLDSPGTESLSGYKSASIVTRARAQSKSFRVASPTVSNPPNTKNKNIKTSKHKMKMKNIKSEKSNIVKTQNKYTIT